MCLQRVQYVLPSESRRCFWGIKREHSIPLPLTWSPRYAKSCRGIVSATCCHFTSFFRWLYIGKNHIFKRGDMSTLTPHHDLVILPRRAKSSFIRNGGGYKMSNSNHLYYYSPLTGLLGFCLSLLQSCPWTFVRRIFLKQHWQPPLPLALASFSELDALITPYTFCFVSSHHTAL